MDAEKAHQRGAGTQDSAVSGEGEILHVAGTGSAEASHAATRDVDADAIRHRDEHIAGLRSGNHLQQRRMAFNKVVINKVLILMYILK